MANHRLNNGKLLEIRPAEPQDAADLLAYLPLVGAESDNLLFGKEGVGMTLEGEQRMLRDIGAETNSIFLLGIIDGAIIATGNVRSSQRERKRHLGTFALAVRKPFWNLGVGGLMGKALMGWARENPIVTVIQLTVRTDNLHAIHLYERLGFRPVGVLHRDLVIRGEYHDTLMMEWMKE